MQVAPMRLFICRASARASPSILSSSSSVTDAVQRANLDDMARIGARVETVAQFETALSAL